ncbi:MAG: hypothetical protein ACRDRV_15085 [Pseudonocardiaceae bacterium]
MVTGHLSGHEVLARRQHRARTWRAVTAGLHLLMAALTVALLPVGRDQPVDALVIIIGLAVAPLAGAFWLERHRPSARIPQQWWGRSLMVAFPQAIALGFAANGVLDKDTPAPWQRILLVVAVSLVPAGTAALAARSLLRPLVPALGFGDVEVLVEPRAVRRPWFSDDSITLTGRELVISVRSGSGRATRNPKVQRIPLGDITAVGARPAVEQDSPWITLSDGRGLSVPPGDVVVLQCRDTTWVLPIDDATVFAEVIRIRAGVAGPSRADRPVVAEPVPPVGHVPAVGHVPEVGRAPEPTGPPAHPVTGPAGAAVRGPGMAARWALGLPLALLGIVGVPVALLWLAPAAPAHRLVFAALWIAVAAGNWLRSWQQPRYWPVWALMSALGTALVVVLDGPGWALLAPVVAVLLTWAGRRVLLRPVGTDLAGSGLEIPVREGNVTLLVQRDRLVLKLRAGAGGAVPQAMPLGGLSVAQAGEFAGSEVRWWPYPGARWTRLGRSPALRLVSGGQQWLLPVPAARELAAIIQARAESAPRRESQDPTAARWHELQAWAARQLTTTRRYGGLTQRTVGWRLAVAVPAAFLGSALLTEMIARGAWGGGFPVVAGVALALAAVLVADWFRVRARLRVAEDHPLPPGSPAWGELRPGHAPLAGWQPWWDDRARPDGLGSPHPMV